MDVSDTELDGVLLFTPTAHYDGRGLFTRTFDTRVFDAALAARAAGAGRPVTASDFVQDSQSRSHTAVIRGMHGRSGNGEAKLVRCARGAIDDVVVDIRPDSPTRGRHQHFRLDDETFVHLFIPPGFLHGFQALTDADVCYRIDREHDPSEDIAVSYRDPDLAIVWPLPPGVMSSRDLSAGPLNAVW